MKEVPPFSAREHATAHVTGDTWNPDRWDMTFVKRFAFNVCVGAFQPDYFYRQATR